MNRFAILFGLVAALPAAAITPVNGPQEGTWTAAGNPYVCSTADITVEKGKTLTLQPGVTVQFGSGRRLTVYGSLSAAGTAASPIVFTSSAASPAPGAWRQIVFQNSATAVLDHVAVQWAGQGGAAAIQIGTVTELPGGLNVSVTSSSVENADGFGFALDTDLQAQHAVLVQGNRVTGATGGVRLMAAIPEDDIRIRNNDFTGAGGPTALTSFLALSAFNASAASFQGNLPADEFTLKPFESMDASVTLWHDLRLQFGGDGIAVPAGVTLTVKPGVTLRFNDGEGLTVAGGGVLNAMGSAEAPVAFVSSASTPGAGAWNGIALEAGAVAAMAYAEVASGGQQATGCLWVNGGSLTLDHGSIHHGAPAGILYDNRGGAQTFSVSNTAFTGTGDAGIRLDAVNPADAVHVAGNTFASVGQPISLPPSALSVFSGGAEAVAGNAPDDRLWLRPSVDPDSDSVPDGVRVWERLASADDVQIPAGAAVAFQPGSGIRLGSGAAVHVYGKLTLAGKPGSLVRVEGVGGAPGDSGGLQFHPGSTGALASSVLLDGGASGGANLRVDGAAVTVDGCAVMNGAGPGVALSGAVTFAMTGSAVRGNAGPGVSDAATGARVLGDAPGYGNDISNNGGGAGPEHDAAVAQAGWLEARHNYWGADTGPYHPELNPNGGGGRVSGHIHFGPFAGAEQTLPVASLQPVRTAAVGTVPVDGTATSALLDHWALEYGRGDPPAAYLPLKTSSDPVTGGRLIDWDTAGIDHRYRYTIRLTVVDVLGRSSTATVVTRSPAGDVNGNGTVGVMDAVMALRFATGKAVPTDVERDTADVRPVPAPDGAITAADVTAILRLAAGFAAMLP